MYKVVSDKRVGFYLRKLRHKLTLNPPSQRSVKQLISRDNITPESNIKVTRIKEMIKSFSRI